MPSLDQLSSAGVVKDCGTVWNGNKNKCFVCSLFSVLVDAIRRHVRNPREQVLFISSLQVQLNSVCPRDDEQVDLSSRDDIEALARDQHEGCLIDRSWHDLCNRFGFRVEVLLVLPHNKEVYEDGGMCIGSRSLPLAGTLLLRRDFADGRSNHFLHLTTKDLQTAKKMIAQTELDRDMALALELQLRELSPLCSRTAVSDADTRAALAMCREMERTDGEEAWRTNFPEGAAF